MNRESYETINHLPKKDLDILIDVLPERVQYFLNESSKIISLVDILV